MPPERFHELCLTLFHFILYHFLPIFPPSLDPSPNSQRLEFNGRVKANLQRSVENWLTDAEKFEPQLLSIRSPSHSYRTSRPIKLLGQGYLVGNSHRVLHATLQTPFKSIVYSAGQ